MNKENIINIDFKELIDYLREKDQLIDHLRKILKIDEENAREMINFIKENDKYIANDIKDKLIEDLISFFEL